MSTESDASFFVTECGADSRDAVPAPEMHGADVQDAANLIEPAAADQIILNRKRALTARQREVLSFMHSYQRVHGYAPTLREIGAHMGIRSTNGVQDHLLALARKGYLVMPDGARSRAHRLTREAHAAMGVDTTAMTVPSSMQEAENASLRATNVRMLKLLGRASEELRLVQAERHARMAAEQRCQDLLLAIGAECARAVSVVPSAEGGAE